MINPIGKHINKVCICFALAFLLLFITSCKSGNNVYNQPFNSREQMILSNIAIIHSDNFVYESDNYLFMSLDEGLYRYSKNNLSDKEKVLGEDTGHHLIYKNKIVYIDFETISTIYSCDLNGNDNKKIYPFNNRNAYVSLLKIYNNYLYYTVYDESHDENESSDVTTKDEGFFRLNMETSETVRLDESTEIINVEIKNEKIYYCPISPQDGLTSTIYRSNLDGSDRKEELTIENICLLFPESVHDEYIYYWNMVNANGNLYRVKKI